MLAGVFQIGNMNSRRCTFNFIGSLLVVVYLSEWFLDSHFCIIKCFPLAGWCKVAHVNMALSHPKTERHPRSSHDKGKRGTYNFTKLKSKTTTISFLLGCLYDTSIPLPHLLEAKLWWHNLGLTIMTQSSVLNSFSWMLS